MYKQTPADDRLDRNVYCLKKKIVIIIIFIKFHKSTTGSQRPAGYRTSQLHTVISGFRRDVVKSAVFWVITRRQNQKTADLVSYISQYNKFNKEQQLH